MMENVFYQRAFELSFDGFVHLAWSQGQAKNTAAMKEVLDVMEGSAFDKLLLVTNVLSRDEKQRTREITLLDAFIQALGPAHPGNLHQEVLWTADQREVFDRLIGVAEACRSASLKAGNLQAHTDPFARISRAGTEVIQDPAFFHEMERFAEIKLGFLSQACASANTAALIAMLDHASLDTSMDLLDSLVPEDREIDQEKGDPFAPFGALVGSGQALKGGLIDFLDALDEKLKTEKGGSPTAHLRADLLRRRLDRLHEPMDSDAMRCATQLMGKEGLDPHRSVLAQEVRWYTDTNHLFGNAKSKGLPLEQSVMERLLNAAVCRHCLPVVDAILPVLQHKAQGPNTLLTHVFCDIGPVSPENLRGTLQRLKANGRSLEPMRGDDGKIVQASALAVLAAMPTHPGDEQKLAALLDVGIDVSARALKGIKFADGAPHRERLMGVIKAHAARSAAHKLLADLDKEPLPSLAP